MKLISQLDGALGEIRTPDPESKSAPPRRVTSLPSSANAIGSSNSRLQPEVRCDVSRPQENALGNRDYFLNKPYGVGGPGKEGDVP